MYVKVEELLRDIVTIKTAYKGFKIYLINPLSCQEILSEHLGLSVVYGNKFKVVKDNLLFKKGDMIFSDEINYFRFVESMFYLLEVDNVTIPQYVNRKNYLLEFSKAKDLEILQGAELVYKITDKGYEALDYYKIKEYMLNTNILTFIEDLPFYLQLIKR